MGDIEIVKYALTQGGLAALCLVVFFYARRDYRERAAEDVQRAAADRDERQVLISLVEKNTAAMTMIAESNSRLIQLLDQERSRR